MALRIKSTTSPQSIDRIRIFLQNQRSGVLATADNGGSPYATPIYYVCDDDYNLFFTAKHGTQKVKNMKQNNKIALAVYDEPTQAVAHILGTVEFIKDKKIQEQVINNLHDASIEKSAENLSPPEKLLGDGFVVARIKPTVIRLAVYIFFKPGDDDLFETIWF